MLHTHEHVAFLSPPDPCPAQVTHSPFSRAQVPPCSTMELSRVSVAFQFRPPYTRGWDTLGRHLYDTLVDEGFSPRQSAGELVAVF